MDQKPGMYETPGLACRTLGIYMVVGAGIWAVIIAAILKVIGWLR